ncbi:uncharacterized protein (TIGR03034 family) [Erwinia toletana]|uniref:Uncharacterized protein (TIGR03034 family) n=1 Tax=Winslowiella toletana TaxID=92490 RepID=A0ABS4P5Q0_9GAMM|nr:uncharacterized protein (TIGR03034 family) [Winslowiella toletana]
MTFATFPQKIFATRRNFNDYGADDMRYGDITEERLKREFNLSNISNLVDPYTLTRLTPFNNPQSRFSGVYGSKKGESVSVQECARLLFTEMQVTSLPYAFYGSYRHLINKMLTHLQKSTGNPFRDMQLDNAYKKQIINDSSKNSSRVAIIDAINKFIDYSGKGYPASKINALTNAIGDTALPKFNSLILDNINGLGITIHDVHATQIYLQSLEVNENHWRAKNKIHRSGPFWIRY